MKKFKVIALLLVTILLVGCSSTKENIDPAKLQATLSDKKFDIYDTTSKVGYASNALYATKGKVKINFVKGSKRYDVQGIFLDECKNIYSVAGSDYTHETDGGKNWTYLIVYNDTDYYFVGWVNDSYISLSAPVDQMKKMNNLVKELGYK